MRRTAMILSTLLLAVPLAAQQTVRIYKNEAGRTVEVSKAAAGDRAMIGVSTSSGSKRDTLGVLIASITAGGPADKAGLAEGDRIQSINGVSLKVSRDDAGDDEMGGVMQRRLTRELGKVKAGDEVAVQVWHDGASKSVKLKTVAADDLRPAWAKSEAKREERAVLGIGFSLTGTKRDTAGVFVNSVTEDGPAEKAGIVEGDRIAAVNGVSLKLSKDDLEDGWVANSRLSRLSREVAKAKPGDAVELTVVSAGRSRAVKVTTVKASALKGASDGGFTIFRSPMEPMPPVPPMPPMHFSIPTPPDAPHAPHAPLAELRSLGADNAEVRVHLDGLRQELERTLRRDLPNARAEMQRGLEEARRQLQSGRVRVWM